MHSTPSAITVVMVVMRIAAGRLVDRTVDQLFKAGLLAHQGAVLADAVVHHDGIVDGVTQNESAWPQ